MTHERSTALERSVKNIFIRGLKPVSRRANLTLTSDVDQRTYMFGLHGRRPNHSPEHTNQDTKRRQSKDKDPTANKTKHRSKRNPTGKPRWARQQPKHQAPSIS